MEKWMTKDEIKEAGIYWYVVKTENDIFFNRPLIVGLKKITESSGFNYYQCSFTSGGLEKDWTFSEGKYEEIDDVGESDLFLKIKEPVIPE